MKPHSEVTDTGSSDDHHSFVSESESDHKQDFESKINDVRNINVKDDTQDLVSNFLFFFKSNSILSMFLSNNMVLFRGMQLT